MEVVGGLLIDLRDDGEVVWVFEIEKQFQRFVVKVKKVATKLNKPRYGFVLLSAAGPWCKLPASVGDRLRCMGSRHVGLC